MAKKFGKTLFLTAAAVSAAAAVYLYLQKKDAAQKDSEEEDYDDFSEDLDRDSESSSNYVPLNTDAAPSEAQTESTTEESPKEDSSKEDIASAPKAAEGAFTPLTQQVAQAAEKAVDTVEEFFDEEDGPGMEPPISDN